MKRKLNIRHLLLLCIPICLVIGFSISIFYRNSEPSNPSENQKVEDQPDLSLEHFLEIAMEPVGQTMYVWGGGWNEEDTGAGVEAVTIGVSDQWASFFEEQDASYDYQNTLYQIHDGLDCSGYVGWAIYNLMQTESGQNGYVMKSGEMAKAFADFGWGSYTPRRDVSDFKPGDIMSNEEHVYIVLGVCEDGSVLLVHASPPGVRICGTDLDQTGTSDAIVLAQQTMAEQYPKWFEKYPSCTVDVSYLHNYDQFRWNTDTLSDASKIQALDASDIIKSLYNE